MFLDALLTLSDGQAVADTDAYSTITIDFGNVTPKRRVGAGEPMSVIVVVDVAAAGDGSPASLTDTFDFALVESANANLGSHTDLITRVLPGASLVAGSVWEFPLPLDGPTKRYVGMRYELGSGDTINVSAYAMPRSMVQAYLAYAKNYAV